MKSSLLILAIASCGTPTPVEVPKETAPDLLLITLDTTRADRIGAFGDPLARTPNLDGLAKQGAVFSSAWTTVPLTLPAHASILTGQYPNIHGVRDNSSGRLPSDVPLLAEQLKEAGYSTAAFVGSYVLDSAWGLDRGFDVYHDRFHPQDIAGSLHEADVQRPAREVVQSALGWWEKQTKPRFLWVHLFDAHRPYEPPVGWTGDPYRGEIFAMDRALLPLLSSVGSETLVVTTADHGENLWDGGELEHGVLLTRSVLRVPLIIRPPGGLNPSDIPPPVPPTPRPKTWQPYPGIEDLPFDLTPVPDAPNGARVVTTPVGVVDIMPTILDWALLPCRQCPGRSLRPAIQGEELLPVPLYAETTYPARHYNWSPVFWSRNQEHIMLATASETLYSATKDPWMQQPLALPHPKELTATIQEHQEHWDKESSPLDPTMEAQLQALGYTTTTPPKISGPRPDPATKIERLNTLFAAQGKMVSAPEQARDALRELLKVEPELIDGHLSLARVLIQLREAQPALAALEEVLQRAPKHKSALQSKAFVLRSLKEFEASREIINTLILLYPEEARWHHFAVDLYGRERDFVGIRDACRAGLQIHPKDPFLHYMLGLAFIQLDAPSEALPALQAAEENGTRAKDIALWQGRAFEQIGNIDQAIEFYHKDASNRPADVRSVAAAGRLLASQEKCGEALPYLLKAIERGVKDEDVLRAYRECGGSGF